MRVRSYLFVVGLTCTVGGLLLSAFQFERQMEVDSNATEMNRLVQIQGDVLRFSDQIKQLFITTDLLFGSQETYVLQASKEQTSAALQLCAKIYKQLTASQDVEKTILGEIHQHLGGLSSTIEALEKQSLNATFEVSRIQLDSFDERSFKLVKLLQALTRSIDAHIVQEQASQGSDRSDFDVLVWFLAILYAGLVVLVLYWAARSVSRPLSQLSSSAKRALVNKDAFEPVVGGPREVRELTEHIAVFVTSLKEKISESEEMSSKLQHQATHDALTGLANRRNLEHVLRRAENARYALCAIDLDRFKLVNDTSGHAAGDELLVQVGRILRNEVRPDDTVVRMGGDEFAVLLRDCDEEHAVVIAEKIRIKIESLVFRWNNTSHRIGCCIGIACSRPEERKTDAIEVLKNADTACFAAKEAGRNRVIVHDGDGSIADELRGDLNWVQIINHALDNDEFLLHGQVIKPLTEHNEFGEINEVLLRLKDRRTGKLVPPGAFMPAAERYGLNTKIDRWVVTNVLKLATAYGRVFDEERTYWINLSGASLCDEAFVEFLFESIRAANPPAGSINFEITETAVIRNLAQAAGFIEYLRTLGCRFALDDFGSGLSSFGYLKTLPVDLIKIDGMFVRGIIDDPIDRKFVQSIIEIAHTMNIRTVVEFVEDDEILNAVRALGADFAQGFGIDRPSSILPRLWSETEQKAASQA